MMRKKLFFWIFLAGALILLGAGAVMYAEGKRAEMEARMVLRVEDKTVEIPEAMIYYRLVREAFIDETDENIFRVDTLGLSAEQTAVERTIESIVRIKAAGTLGLTLGADEVLRVEESAEKLSEVLGEAYMQRHGISRELCYRVMEENYLSSRFESSARFVYSDIEADLEAGLQERFEEYETLDQEDYLTRMILWPIMFYTGQWSEGRWSSYPDAEKQQILERALTLSERLTAAEFWRLGQFYADSMSLEENPLFTSGEVLCPETRFGSVYAGQLSEEVKETALSLEPGTLSGVMETEYGYLILYKLGSHEPFEADYREYSMQLIRAKNAYRTELISSLRGQRMEAEWERLTAGLLVETYPERLEKYLDENFP